MERTTWRTGIERGSVRVRRSDRPGTSAAEVARRYGIAERVLRRWKQELVTTVPTFVTVQVTDEDAALCAISSTGGPA